ncbi:MAG TPA: YidC/Oxa1 family membrane protein insertase [bacterium]|nr:YidC/Oxa1 family membrane protein insertase [bacterium]
MSFVWNELLFRPIYNLFILIYDLLPIKDAGLAIILLTVLVRFILMPLTWTAMKSQRLMQSKSGEMKAIQEKYKDDKQQQSQALMQFYKDNGINPLSSCLPLLIQLPVMIALYRVLKDLNKDHWDLLYSFVARPDSLNVMFLNIIDLTKPFWPLAVLTGLSQFVYSWLMQNPKGKNKAVVETKKKDTNGDGEALDPEAITNMMSSQFLYMMPLMTTFVAWNLMSGLSVYWVSTTLFNIVFQLLMVKWYPVKDNNEVIIENVRAEEIKWDTNPKVLETSKNNDVTISVKKRQ